MKASAPQGKFACTVKVGDKGQIVIPKEARALFDIRPGDTLMLLADRRRGIAIPPKERFEKVAQSIFAASFPESDETEDGGEQ